MMTCVQDVDADGDITNEPMLAGEVPEHIEDLISSVILQLGTFPSIDKACGLVDEAIHAAPWGLAKNLRLQGYTIKKRIFSIT